MTRSAALLVLLAVVPALLAAPVPRSVKRKAADWMPLEAGCKWEYVSADDHTAVVDVREITAAEERDGGLVATQKTSNLTQEFRRDEGGVAVLKANGRAGAGERYITKQGMKEGDTWENDMGGYTEVRTVGKAEKLTLPAGVYEAVPVKFQYVQNGSAFQTGTVWYADGVGLVRIDTDGQPSQVLKAFTKGK
jgi:hypothetical protein